MKCSTVVVIGVDRHGVGRDNSPSLSPAPPHNRGYPQDRLLLRVELSRIHKSRKSRPRVLRFRVVLTEGDTNRLEWQMS
jgi:hypothetical protein